MALKRTWVVRVVHKVEDEREARAWLLILEQFRHAGLIQWHKRSSDHLVFDLIPRQGVASDRWAKMNAERMRSFGLNAVEAPAWESYVEASDG